LIAALISTFLIYLLDRRAPYKVEEPPNPKSDNFMKGYKKPDIPKKSMTQLLALEPIADKSLPLVDLKELGQHIGGD